MFSAADLGRVTSSGWLRPRTSKSPISNSLKPVLAGRVFSDLSLSLSLSLSPFLGCFAIDNIPVIPNLFESTDATGVTEASSAPDVRE